MAFVYVITNRINGKQYVGKTTHTSIEARWKEHVQDSKRRKCEKRPLYSAINKYGAENFTVEQLEEGPINIIDEREVYWIEKLDTYHNGYNATYGGDGKILYDYKKIADKYLELQNQKETAKYFNCDIETVRKACLEYDIAIKSSHDVCKKLYGKKVLMLDLKTNKPIQSFDTVGDAYKFLGKSSSSHIQEVCNGKRQTAYGYDWQWLK